MEQRKVRTNLQHAEIYFQSRPHGFNSLRVHALLMGLCGVVLFVITLFIQLPFPVELGVTESMREIVWALMWIVVALPCIGSGIIYAVSCYRFGLAVQYGLPEPGIREWPVFKAYLAALHARQAERS